MGGGTSDHGQAGRGRRHHDRPAGAKFDLGHGAPTGPRRRPQADGARLEPRSARHPDPATRPLGWRAIGPGAPAGRRGRVPPRPSAPRRPHRGPPPRQGPSLPDGDRSRSLCRPSLGHAGADPAGADLRHRGAGRRGHCACARGAGRPPGRADDLAAGDLRIQSRRGAGSAAGAAVPPRRRREAAGHTPGRRAAAGRPGHGRDPRPLRLSGSQLCLGRARRLAVRAGRLSQPGRKGAIKLL